MFGAIPRVEVVRLDRLKAGTCAPGDPAAKDPRERPALRCRRGVQKLLVYSGVETEGKHVVVVGRSNIVGKPVANMLLQKAKEANATVTVCHSRTKDLPAVTRQADILIAAIGVPVLMLHGEDDAHPGAATRATLQPFLPQLEYVSFPRCGHVPWRERHAHAAFERVLIDWLERHA